MSRVHSLLASIAVAAASVACCANGTCIKDPPCKCGENPCCLTPIQKAALKVNTHALPSGPTIYSFNNKTFFLFSEKGLKDFEKDPTTYDEKGAIRLIRKGKTYRVDVDPGEYDFAAEAGRAVPYTAPPPPPKK